MTSLHQENFNNLVKLKTCSLSLFISSRRYWKWSQKHKAHRFQRVITCWGPSATGKFQWICSIELSVSGESKESWVNACTSYNFCTKHLPTAIFFISSDRLFLLPVFCWEENKYFMLQQFYIENTDLPYKCIYVCMFGVTF